MGARRHLLVLLLLVASGAFASCGDDTVSTEEGSGDTTSTSAVTDDRAADIVGTITSVTPFEPVTTDCVDPADLDPDGSVSDQDPPVCTPADSTRAGTFLVEEEPGAQRGRKISFSVDASTTITDADGVSHGGPEAFDQLVVGSVVEGWSIGPCAESYPEQCGAALVVLQGDS